MVLIFEFLDEIVKCNRLNKATEQFVPVWCRLCIMLYKMVLTFQSADEILKCDHSNESYRTVLSRGASCQFQFSPSGNSSKIIYFVP